MVFAAGHGTRMRALTNDLPKPLISVAGKTLIDRALDLADAAGFQRKVVNTHYLGHMLAAHLAGRSDVVISHEEEEALETGGGLKNALPLLGENPVMTLNPDAIWSGGNPLEVLLENWRHGQMAGLLMLVPLDRATNYKGSGDFCLDDDGRITRFTAGSGTKNAFVYTGAQIIQTDGLKDVTERVFSINPIWDKMISEGSLFGCVHTGGWIDVGNPEGIPVAETMLRDAGHV